MKMVSDMACDDPDIGELLRQHVIMASMRPSPYFPPTSDQLRRWQLWKNAHLKLALTLKRRYQAPIKPLPLP